jgi:hypothetical protein
MTQHLSDKDLLEILLDRSPGFNAHLATCSSCRAERKRMRHVLGELPALTRIVAQNDDAFWEQQRTAIWAKIDSVDARKFPVLAWASAAAVLVAATLLFSIAPSVPPRAQADSDHELMIQLERTLQSEVPVALEPAALLAREITENSQLNSPPPVRKKESNHEN